jgi:hypothetical protein
MVKFAIPVRTFQQLTVTQSCKNKPIYPVSTWACLVSCRVDLRAELCRFLEPYHLLASNRSESPNRSSMLDNAAATRRGLETNVPFKTEVTSCRSSGYVRTHGSRTSDEERVVNRSGVLPPSKRVLTVIKTVQS